MSLAQSATFFVDVIRQDAGLIALFILAALAVTSIKPSRRWRRGGSTPQRVPRHPFARIAKPVRPQADVFDGPEQLRIVTDAVFTRKPLMSRAEARVFFAVERAIRAAQLNWRVMAQVSLGEILASSDARAYRAINSKRVDILIITGAGDPVAAVEYQGQGHYQANAAVRDAVKREALRRAGVGFVEIRPDFEDNEIVLAVQKLARTHEATPA